jgi:hypothetical protein
MWTRERALVAFVVGGIAGALLDQIHVRYQVLRYPDPWLFGQAWWVAPLFGLATLTIVSAADWWIARRPDAGRDEGVLEAASMFVAAYWASGQWHQHPIGLSIAYAVVMPLRTTRASTLAFAGLLGLGGMLWEIGLTRTGAFRYNFPDVLGVPLWLPGLYMHGAALALAIARALRPAGPR